MEINPHDIIKVSVPIKNKLGAEIKKQFEGIYLSQTKYNINIIIVPEDSNMKSYFIIVCKQNILDLEKLENSEHYSEFLDVNPQLIGKSKVILPYFETYNFPHTKTWVDKLTYNEYIKDFSVMDLQTLVTKPNFKTYENSYKKLYELGLDILNPEFILSEDIKHIDFKIRFYQNYFENTNEYLVDISNLLKFDSLSLMKLYQISNDTFDMLRFIETICGCDNEKIAIIISDDFWNYTCLMEKDMLIDVLELDKLEIDVVYDNIRYLFETKYYSKDKQLSSLIDVLDDYSELLNIEKSDVFVWRGSND